jgi:DNA-binding response OmpR family regulator
MSKIVAIEDDVGTRMLIAALLKKDGHTVLEADNGIAGLKLVADAKPDLVVSDVEMPQMDGLQMLANMRADPELAEIPVILLTSLDGRSAMRAGMTGGADDYITKPFRPVELREAVMAQLQRVATRQTLHQIATQEALEQQKLALDEMYMAQYSSKFGSQLTMEPTGKDERFANATLMAVNIESYAKLAARLSNTELTDVVRHFYAAASDGMNLFSPHHVEFDGAGMVALFVAKDDSDSVNHALRAAKAAFGVIDAAGAADQRMKRSLGDRVAGDLVVNVALDSGPVSLTRVTDALGSGRSHTVLVGETLVTTKALLQPFALRQWKVAGTVQALRSMSGGIRMGRRDMITLPGKSVPLDAGEIAGMVG